MTSCVAEARGRRVLRACVLLLAGLVSAPAAAHEFRTAYLEIRALDAGQYSLSWRMPAQAASEADVVPVVSPDCRLQAGQDLRSERLRIRQYRLDCLGGQGWIALQGLELQPQDAVARIVAAGQPDRFLHLQGQRNRVDLAAPAAEPARNNLFLEGMRHVFGGYDHLLYISLLFLCLRGRWRELLLGVTCFTLAHSLTLGLAAFGRLQVPTRPVEAVIGLTIAYFAITLLRGRDRVPGWRLHAAILLCGLIHGLGFANSLGDLELARGDLLWGLASFNLGIEFAQILCLLAAAAVLALGSRLGGIARAQGLEHVFVTLVGAVGAFWYFQRLLA
jgi:hypothetical protein